MHDQEKDGIFLIEEIIAKKREKNKELFLIKWKGYSTQTWEPASTVPQFLRDAFIKTGSGRLPKPRIRNSKVCGKLYIIEDINFW